MTVRLLTFAIWAVAAASAAFWGLRLLARPASTPDAVVATQLPVMPGGNLVRLFGAPPPAPVAVAAPVGNRFRLLGVVAPRGGQRSGLALISVDGRPARPLGVGARVDGEVRVLAVSHRRVDLGVGGPGASRAGGGATIALELPAVPEPNRGAPMPAPAIGGVPASIGLPGALPGAVPGAPGATLPRTGSPISVEPQHAAPLPGAPMPMPTPMPVQPQMQNPGLQSPAARMRPARPADAALAQR